MSATGLSDPHFYAQSLRENAKILRVGNFTNAAKILEDVANRIELDSLSSQFLEESYKGFEAAILQEYSKEKWELDIFNDVDAIITKGSPAFKDALRLLRNTVEPQTICNTIFQLAKSQQDITTHVHLLCYSYLIMIEGVYGNVMRFLYAYHVKKSRVTTKLWKIAEEFVKDGTASSLLIGWNSTIRNAIAHATYYIDYQNNMIKFVDKRKTKNIPFGEFLELVKKAGGVSPAVVVDLILRILVPLNFAEVKQVSSIS